MIFRDQILPSINVITRIFICPAFTIHQEFGLKIAKYRDTCWFDNSRSFRVKFRKRMRENEKQTGSLKKQWQSGVTEVFHQAWFKWVKRRDGWFLSALQRDSSTSAVILHRLDGSPLRVLRSHRGCRWKRLILPRFSLVYARVCFFSIQQSYLSIGGHSERSCPVTFPFLHLVFIFFLVQRW